MVCMFAHWLLGDFVLASIVCFGLGDLGWMWWIVGTLGVMFTMFWGLGRLLRVVGYVGWWWFGCFTL